MTDEELDEIMEKCDPSGNGKITYESFYQNMKDAVAVKKSKVIRKGKY